MTASRVPSVCPDISAKGVNLLGESLEEKDLLWRRIFGEATRSWAVVPDKAVPPELRRFFRGCVVIPLAGTRPPA